MTCIDLVNQYPCAPSLGVLPGDTILAAYQDPSNHSDYVWISIKVSIGGAEPVGLSTTSFVDAEGNPVAAYVEGDLVYVRVEDPTLAGAGTINDAVTIAGVTYDLAPLAGEAPGWFITAGLDLHGRPGDTLTASYVDPTDPTDTSSASIQDRRRRAACGQVLRRTQSRGQRGDVRLHRAGLADLFTAAVYDLQGHLVWSSQALERAVGRVGRPIGRRNARRQRSVHLHRLRVLGGTNSFSGKGTVFIRR